MDGKAYMGHITYNTSSAHAMWLCNIIDDDYDEDEEEYFDKDLLELYENDDYYTEEDFESEYMDDCECDRCEKTWNSKAVDEFMGYVCNGKCMCGMECLKLEIAELYEEENDEEIQDVYEDWEKIESTGFLKDNTNVESWDEVKVDYIEEGELWDKDTITFPRLIMV